MKAINVTDLDSKKVKRVFVLNKTQSHEKGIIVMAFPKPNGQGTDTALIPNTFIPVELTAQVSKTQIIASNDFRRALASGRMQLIHEDDATVMLKSESAQRELRKIAKDQEAFSNNVMDLNEVYSNIEVNTTGAQSMMNELKENGQETTVATNGEKVKKSAKIAVQQLIEDLKENKDEDSAISTMMNIENLDRTDYKYIYKNAGKFLELKKEAEKYYNMLKKK